MTEPMIAWKPGEVSVWNGSTLVRQSADAPLPEQIASSRDLIAHATPRVADQFGLPPSSLGTPDRTGHNRLARAALVYALSELKWPSGNPVLTAPQISHRLRFKSAEQVERIIMAEGKPA